MASTVTARPRSRVDSLELGSYDSAVPSARLHARAVLGEWGLGLILDEAESVVAEVITNAIQATRHAGLDSGVRLILNFDGEGVLISAWDAVPLPPAPASPDADSESGRGLMIVQALAAWWDAYPIPSARGGGKLVRAMLTMP